MSTDVSSLAAIDATQRPLPVCVHTEPATDLAVWAVGERPAVDAALLQHGAVLLRGADISSGEAFERVADVLCGPRLDYVYRSTPRTAVGDKVYTATEYRADAAIPFHNENAFQRDWPMRLAFCCVQPAASGGATPLASTSRVTHRIDRGILQRFADKGVMYVRNYGQGVDLTWQVVFQTEEPADVERYCRTHDIEWEWLSAEHLRTRQVCQGVATHPITHELLWFNQAHLFHVSSLDAETRAVLIDLFGEEGLPRHAYYGDGTPIGEDALEHIRRCYDAEAVSFDWQRGDVLLLDNMLVAHARAPYTGPRKVLVAMGEPYSTTRRP